LAWVKDPSEYARWNLHPKDVPFCCQAFLLCSLDCRFGPALVALCVTQFEEGSSIVSHFGGCPNVVKGGEGGVDEESLADGGVEHLKPHVMRPVDSGYGFIVGASMEGAAIDSLVRVHTPLQRGDTVNLDVSDVGAGLTLTKVIRILNRVVAGV